MAMGAREDGTWELLGEIVALPIAIGAMALAASSSLAGALGVAVGAAVVVLGCARCAPAIGPNL
jgi:hypothetical protein